MNVGFRQIIGVVYPWLDLRSRGRLHQTSKEFRTLNITLYVLRNYEVINFSQELNQIFISPRRIIAMGETHTEEAHRYSNSHLIKLLWSNHALLAVEGSQETLKGWKSSADNNGMLTYLPEGIKERAISWDLESVDNGLDDYINFSKMAVIATKALLRFSRSKKLSSSDYVKFIDRHFVEPLKTLLKTESIDRLSQEDGTLSIKQKIDFKTLIYREMTEALFNYINHEDDIHDEKVKLNNFIRNKALLAKLREMRQEKTPGFLIAGTEHIMECSKEFEKTFTDCLMIRPKNRTISQIQGDLISLFPRLLLHPIPSISDEIIENKHLSIVKNNTVTESEIHYLKESLSALRVSSIDCDKNHFSVWVHTCLLILEWELQYPAA